jgi:hypothetical protein
MYLLTSTQILTEETDSTHKHTCSLQCYSFHSGDLQKGVSSPEPPARLEGSHFGRSFGLHLSWVISGLRE